MDKAAQTQPQESRTEGTDPIPGLLAVGLTHSPACCAPFWQSPLLARVQLACQVPSSLPAELLSTQLGPMSSRLGPVSPKGKAFPSWGCCVPSQIWPQMHPFPLFLSLGKMLSSTFSDFDV